MHCNEIILPADCQATRICQKHWFPLTDTGTDKLQTSSRPADYYVHAKLKPTFVLNVKTLSAHHLPMHGCVPIQSLFLTLVLVWPVFLFLVIKEIFSVTIFYYWPFRNGKRELFFKASCFFQTQIDLVPTIPPLSFFKSEKSFQTPNTCPEFQKLCTNPRFPWSQEMSPKQSFPQQ